MATSVVSQEGLRKPEGCLCTQGRKDGDPMPQERFLAEIHGAGAASRHVLVISRLVCVGSEKWCIF